MNWNCIDMLTNKYVQLMRFYLNSSYIPQLGKWHPSSPSTQTLGQKLGSDPGSLSFSLLHLIAHSSLSSSPWSLLSTTNVAALMYALINAQSEAGFLSEMKTVSHSSSFSHLATWAQQRCG